MQEKSNHTKHNETHKASIWWIVGDPPGTRYFWYS